MLMRTNLSKLDPYRCLQILHLPIKAMRVVTDPVVDSSIFLVTHAILPTILRFARRQVQTCYTFIMFLVRHLVGATIADKITHAVHSAVGMHFYRFQPKPEDILSLVGSIAATHRFR